MLAWILARRRKATVLGIGNLKFYGSFFTISPCKIGGVIGKADMLDIVWCFLNRSEPLDKDGQKGRMIFLGT